MENVESSTGISSHAAESSRSNCVLESRDWVKKRIFALHGPGRQKRPISRPKKRPVAPKKFKALQTYVVEE